MIFTLPAARAQPLSYKLRFPPHFLLVKVGINNAHAPVPCPPCCLPAPAPTRSITPLPSNPSPKCEVKPPLQLFARASLLHASQRQLFNCRAHSNPAVTFLIVGLLFSRLTIATIISGMTRCVRARLASPIPLPLPTARSADL